MCLGFFFVCVYLGFILVYFSLFLIFSLDGDFWLVIISVCFGFFFAGFAAGLCRVMI